MIWDLCIYINTDAPALTHPSGTFIRSHSHSIRLHGDERVRRLATPRVGNPADPARDPPLRQEMLRPRVLGDRGAALVDDLHGEHEVVVAALDLQSVVPRDDVEDGAAVDGHAPEVLAVLRVVGGA